MCMEATIWRAAVVSTTHVEEVGISAFKFLRPSRGARAPRGVLMN